MSTVSAKPHEVERAWFVVDAEDLVLGRVCTRIATVLRGKHKPSFTPHVDTGDFVVVINAEKVHMTGRKLEHNSYYRYSGYFGGLKATPAAEVRANNPERMFQHAIKGMLPKNKLGRAMIKKLKVYAGPEHPHVAQKPQPLPEYV